MLEPIQRTCVPVSGLRVVLNTALYIIDVVGGGDCNCRVELSSARRRCVSAPGFGDCGAWRLEALISRLLLSMALGAACLEAR